MIPLFLSESELCPSLIEKLEGDAMLNLKAVPQTRVTGMAMAAAAALLVSACAGMQGPTTARAEPGAVATLDRYSTNKCNPVVADALAGVHVPIAQVDGLSYGLYRDDRRGRIIMYDAFVSLKDQPGNIVVQVGADCSLRQTYARGGAELPQVAEQ